VTWSPDSRNQVRLRYERIVGQLDFGDFIATTDLSATGVTSGNADLRPDQRTQYQVSYEWHFWEKGAIVLSAMHESIKDVVDLVPVTVGPDTFDAPGNIGDGTNNEFKIQLTLPLDHLGIDGGRLTSTAIWDVSQVTDPVTGEKRVISGQRPQNIRANFTQDIDSLKSTWGLFWYNGWDEKYYRLELIRHRHLTPPFVGGFWDYKPSSDWTFHFELDNASRFIFRDRRFHFTGPRDTSPLGSIEEVTFRSQPHLDIEIRKTF
jgi:outer membrane receptor protein involved in Fe transport